MTEKTEGPRAHTHTWTHRTPATSNPEHPWYAQSQLSAPAQLQSTLSSPLGYVHYSFPVRTRTAQRYCCCTGGGGRTPRSCETTPARQCCRNCRNFVWKRLRGTMVPLWNRRDPARTRRIPGPRRGPGGVR